MSEIKTNFSACLRKARGDKPQKEFADFLGIVQQSYSRYEKALQIPDGEVLHKIALKLNCSVDSLLGRTRYPAHQPNAFVIQETPNKNLVAKLRVQVEKLESEIGQIKITIGELEK